jgi:hypothetical protein
MTNSRCGRRDLEKAEVRRGGHGPLLAWAGRHGNPGAPPGSAVVGHRGPALPGRSCPRPASRRTLRWPRGAGATGALPRARGSAVAHGRGGGFLDGFSGPRPSIEWVPRRRGWSALRPGRLAASLSRRAGIRARTAGDGCETGLALGLASASGSDYRPANGSAGRERIAGKR